MVVEQGIYTHIKGKSYKVFGEISDLEENPFVLYRALYAERRLWIRPLEMFLENVNGVARFAFVSPTFTNDLEEHSDFTEFNGKQYLGIATHSESLKPYLIFRMEGALRVRELL